MQKKAVNAGKTHSSSECFLQIGERQSRAKAGLSPRTAKALSATVLSGIGPRHKQRVIKRRLRGKHPTKGSQAAGSCRNTQIRLTRNRGNASATQKPSTTHNTSKDVLIAPSCLPAPVLLGAKNPRCLSDDPLYRWAQNLGKPPHPAFGIVPSIPCETRRDG